MQRWAASDAGAAANWLGHLPDSASRDQAVSTFAGRISSSDPQAALQWAATIGDQGMRDSQTESAARSWLKTDPRSATAWISNSTLPNDTKTRLLTPNG